MAENIMNNEQNINIETQIPEVSAPTSSGAFIQGALAGTGIGGLAAVGIMKLKQKHDASKAKAEYAKQTKADAKAAYRQTLVDAGLIKEKVKKPKVEDQIAFLTNEVVRLTKALEEKNEAEKSE